MIVSSGSFTPQPFTVQNWHCLALLLKKGRSGSLALLLLPLCGVSMAMIRGEGQLRFLLARCHQAGYQALGIFVFFPLLEAGEEIRVPRAGFSLRRCLW